MKKPNIKISPQNKMSKEQMKRFSPLMEKKQKANLMKLALNKVLTLVTVHEVDIKIYTYKFIIIH